MTSWPIWCCIDTGSVVMDTQWQNFCVESINKEASLRFQWHLRYSKQFAKTSFNSKPKKEGMKFGNETAQRLRLLEEQSSNDKPQPTNQRASSQDKPATRQRIDFNITDMRPATPNTRALLYSGLSAHGEGRKAYLAKRREHGPDEKYEFPLMTSSNYGWKINDYVVLKKSPCGRTSVIRDSFYRPSGIILG